MLCPGSIGGVPDVLYRIPRRALAPLRRVPDDAAKEVRMVAGRADLHVRPPAHGATESGKGARQKCHGVPLCVLLCQLHDAPEDSPVSLLLHRRPYLLSLYAPAGNDAKASGRPETRLSLGWVAFLRPGCVGDLAGLQKPCGT